MTSKAFKKVNNWHLSPHKNFALPIYLVHFWDLVISTIFILFRNPRKRQRRNSGSITEPEITVKDFAKNLKDESDTMSSASHPQESLKREPDHDDSDDNSINRNSFDQDTKPNNQGNVNPGSFLGMAAASLMDPSAAKGTFF